jgi:hypothetical protein
MQRRVEIATFDVERATTRDMLGEMEGTVE